jgi:hypothetical protein
MDKSERIPGIVQTGKSPMILGEGLLMLSVHCKRQESFRTCPETLTRCLRWHKVHPSGAKARVDFGGIYGTAEAVPFQYIP